MTRSHQSPPPAPRASFALAVYSMWLREVVRFVRQKSRVAGAMGTPLVFWLVLGAGFGGSFRPAGSVEGVGYLEYFLPGIIILTVLFTAIYSTISVIEDRQEGFMQGVLVAPVSRASVVLGKALGDTTLAFVQGAALLLVGSLIGVKLTWSALPGGLAVLFVVALALTGLGLMMAWSMRSTSGFHALMNLLLMPMWLLSGAVFPYAQAHAVVKVAMLANPLTYGVSAFRQIVFADPGGTANAPLSLWPCIGVTLVFSTLTMAGAVALANRRNDTGR